MYFWHKKSKLTAWWVARKGDIFTFVDICSMGKIPDDLVVVGYLKDSITRRCYYPELATSSNYVVKVTKKGVITSKGSFYPFRQAHALYMVFLKLVNEHNNNIAIATHWRIVNGRMNADIIKNGKTIKDVTFDFESTYKDNVVVSGFSEELDSDVIVCTFARRDVCATLHVPHQIKDDIKENADFVYERERIEYIDAIRKLLQ
jgi:hypothetical protein